MKDLEQYLASQACTELIHRYSHFVDLGHRSRIPTLFVEDGVLVFPDQRIEGRAALAEWYKVDEPNRTSRHVCTNTVIDTNGPYEAVGTTFLTVYAHEGPVNPLNPVAPPVRIGHYNDRFRRTAEGWLFQERVVVFAFGERLLDPRQPQHEPFR